MQLGACTVPVLAGWTKVSRAIQAFQKCIRREAGQIDKWGFAGSSACFVLFLFDQIESKMASAIEERNDTDDKF